MTLTQEIAATVFFALAILHTFSVKQFQHMANKYPEGSVGENLFHLVGEVEVVFGLWAGLYLLFIATGHGSEEAIHYLESRHFTEPAFVFVIMTVCSCKPILVIAEQLIENVSKLLPLPRPLAFYASTLVLGPLLGSFITEPAAMTVTALIILNRFYKRRMSSRMMYGTLGLLFVNVSIGGTLTPYAAPPVVMVAGKWNWDLAFMMQNFGWRALLAILAATIITVFLFRKELLFLTWENSNQSNVKPIPVWISVVHLLFLALIVVNSHHMTVFAGIFLFFLGLTTVTKEYQEDIKIKEGLLVGFFLGGLVVLGGPQRWWLEPLLSKLDVLPLYLGAIGLTAITDNAALTYLGSQVPHLPDVSKYALVAGSVVGGGLTVIANAPNPAGYGILNSSFGEEGINPIELFKWALGPTLIAAIFFWL
ncbi:MAG: putative Na+/H+ antiporter [Oligoflexia bacterium]|nr:putative Na+/H+ antiporter [Oligoflexia bacterium]